jgi:hypothetical protein
MLVPPTNAAKIFSIVLSPVALAYIAEIEKAMKYAEKMSTGPNLYELLFPAK